MSRGTVSITFNRREVHNPLLRKLLAAVVILGGGIAILAAALGLLLLAVTVVVWVPLHFLLVALGRRGFVTRTGGHLEIKVGFGGFRKAEHRKFFEDPLAQDELIRKLRDRR